MGSDDDVWNVGGTGEYPPLNPFFTNIGDAYFDCIWRVAGVLTGNISWISPAGVPQSSLSRFIGVLCFFYTLLLNAVLISEVGTVMAAVLNSDADADERDEIFAVQGVCTIIGWTPKSVKGFSSTTNSRGAREKVVYP